MQVSLVVEGTIDEFVAGVLIRNAGGTVGQVHGRKGKARVIANLSGYNQAAATMESPWFVLVDLDHDEDCAPSLRRRLLPEPAPSLCFRVAVREVESWLLADRDRVASYFGIARAAVPASPETLPHPKQTLVDLCRGSRSRRTRTAMVPRPGSGRAVGSGYTNEVIGFISDQERGWRCEMAAQAAHSLRRAMACLQRLMGTR